MQVLSCYISVAGDDTAIVVREHDNAVTYPELLVLKALHGTESVRHIADAGDVDRTSAEERDRLTGLYGAEIVKMVFPGDYQPLPEFDTRMRAKDTVFDAPAEKAGAGPAAHSRRK